jgi:RNA polymerase sigma-54 factor
MKPTISTQLGQQLHLTPQLLQSIRLLQLDGLQLELEIRRMLEANPLLEIDEEQQAAAERDTPDAEQAAVATLDAAAFDELPESSMWDVPSASWQDGDEDRMQNIAAGESSDPQLRALNRLALELDEHDLDIARFWLEHVDDAGYLDDSAGVLARLAAARFDVPPSHAEIVRQRIVHGDPAGLASCDLRECLRAQLLALPAPAPGRPLALRVVDQCLALLGDHDLAAIAARLDVEPEQVEDAIALVLSLQPRPGEALLPDATPYVVPDVVVWHADRTWHVALNPATAPRVRVHAQYERMLAEDDSPAAQQLREMLGEARGLTRGLSVRYDTLLRTARVIVERQAGFLARGDEAMAPLTLKDVAEAIGMHESTVSRITTGKYVQTPRGTFELKHFFAVRLEGASVSGQAVKAMVRKLIDAEPAGRPLSDEIIAGLLSRQGVNIARRTVAKYREQLGVPSARGRRQVNLPALARAG